MDAKFTEVSPLDLEEVLENSDNSIPFLFLLSGVDPLGQLTALAASKNLTVRQKSSVQSSRAANPDTLNLIKMST